MPEVLSYVVVGWRGLEYKFDEPESQISLLHSNIYRHKNTFLEFSLRYNVNHSIYIPESPNNSTIMPGINFYKTGFVNINNQPLYLIFSSVPKKDYVNVLVYMNDTTNMLRKKIPANLDRSNNQYNRILMPEGIYLHIPQRLTVNDLENNLRNPTVLKLPGNKIGYSFLGIKTVDGVV